MKRGVWLNCVIGATAVAAINQLDDAGSQFVVVVLPPGGVGYPLYQEGGPDARVFDTPGAALDAALAELKSLTASEI